MLEAPQGVAPGGRVGRTPSKALGPLRRSGSDRLAEGLFRLGECGRPRGAKRPVRIRQIRERRAPSALRCGRPKRHPALGDPFGCKRPRLEALGGSGGCYLSDPQASSWTPTQAPREAARLHKGYDFPRRREALRKRGITPRIARRGIESSEKLGRYRWIVERTLSWMNRNRRLKVRYERREDIHQAFRDILIEVAG